MSTMAATAKTRTGGMTKDERFVILASSLGTVFEWYDFYLFGSLASVIGAQFFGVIDPATKLPMFNQATRDIFALLAFAAGFIVRPFGAIVFGRVGDIVGRKYTFLVTILIMGLSTFIVGMLPNAATIGIAAPIILIGLRLLQGLALGGEYGGAATYVAEHSPHGQTRLLHLVHPDHCDAGSVPVAAGDSLHHGLRQQQLRRHGLRRNRLHRDSRALSGADRSCPRRQGLQHRVPELGLAHSVPGFGPAARHLGLDPAAPQRIASVPEDEGRGQELESSADRSLRQLEQRQDRHPGADRRHHGSGRGLVYWPVLCAVLHAVDSQGRCLHRQPADRMVAVVRYRLLHRVRRIVRQDRPQADHPGGLPDCGADLLPDLQDDRRQRQPGAGEGHRNREGRSRRRQGRLRRSVQPGRYPPVLPRRAIPSAPSWPSPRSSIRPCTVPPAPA